MKSQNESINRKDTDLIQEHLAHPDSDAFECIVKKYYAQVHLLSQINSKDPSQADDIAQTVFMILSQRIDKINGNHLAGWLMKTTKFVSLNAQRFEYRYQNKLSEYQQKKHDLSVESDDLCDEIFEGLKHLKDRQKELICLRFIEGLSFKQIAERLNISENAAQLATVKAKNKLYTWLAKRNKGLSSLSLAVPFKKIQGNLDCKSTECLDNLEVLFNSSSISSGLSKQFLSLALIEKIKVAAMIFLGLSLVGSIPVSLHGNKGEGKSKSELSQSYDSSIKSNLIRSNKQVQITSTLFSIDNLSEAPWLEKVHWKSLDSKKDIKYGRVQLNKVSYDLFNEIKNIQLKPTIRTLDGNEAKISIAHDSQDYNKFFILPKIHEGFLEMDFKLEMMMDQQLLRFKKSESKINLNGNDMIIYQFRHPSKDQDMYFTIKTMEWSEGKDNSKQSEKIDSKNEPAL